MQLKAAAKIGLTTVNLIVFKVNIDLFPHEIVRLKHKYVDSEGALKKLANVCFKIQEGGRGLGVGFIQW